MWIPRHSLLFGEGITSGPFWGSLAGNDHLPACTNLAVVESVPQILLLGSHHRWIERCRTWFKPYVEVFLLEIAYESWHCSSSLASSLSSTYCMFLWPLTLQMPDRSIFAFFNLLTTVLRARGSWTFCRCFQEWYLPQCPVHHSIDFVFSFRFLRSATHKLLEKSHWASLSSKCKHS